MTDNFERTEPPADCMSVPEHVIAQWRLHIHEMSDEALDDELVKLLDVIHHKFED